jgi:hypothetical protein
MAVTSGPAPVGTSLAARDPKLAEALLDEVVAVMLRPERLPPTAAIAATSAVLAGTSWKSYRAGRMRLATQAAVYLNWLAPTGAWDLADIWDIGGRKVFTWSPAESAPGGHHQGFADLLLARPGGYGKDELFIVGAATGPHLARPGTTSLAGVRISSWPSPWHRCGLPGQGTER